MDKQFEEAIKNTNELEIGHRKVRIITGKCENEVIKLAAEFEKTHTVIDSKQYTEKVMFMFYLE